MSIVSFLCFHVLFFLLKHYDNNHSDTAEYYHGDDFTIIDISIRLPKMLSERASGSFAVLKSAVTPNT